MAWKDGPLPPKTYNWGGVVLKDYPPNCFSFADFRGDHVIISPGDERIEAADVVKYDNSLQAPGWMGGPDTAAPSGSRLGGGGKKPTS